MNRIISFLLICILFASCTSSRKMVIRGFYDQAISKATYKLKKHPTKEKQINALNDAYRLANQINNDKIKFLRQEGKPDNWNEIYLNYTSLQNRQNIVKTLPQSVLNRINFSFIDYDKEIIASKQKAVDYSYAHAMELLKKNTKSDARKSYDELMLVKNYSQNYKDVDAQIQNAISNGRTYILFKMQNKTMIPLPEKFEEELLKISLSEYNSLWQTFDTKAVDGKKYDYVVLANIKNIEIGPESVKEREYTETKVVDDGWSYKLDSKGNVMKDSLGNDIKINKTKTISCYLKEVQLKKIVSILGALDFIETNTNQIIKTNPIKADAIFDYPFVKANGDRNAMTEETKKKLRQPAPFTSTPEMIIQAVQTMKNMSKDIVSKNRNLFY